MPSRCSRSPARISQPIIGHFIDRIDPRPVITTGIIIFTIASAAPAIPNAAILFIARALLGVSSGMVIVACYTIIARLYEDAHLRRMANARFMALEMIGSIVGPVLGSVTFWLSGSFSISLYRLLHVRHDCAGACS